jgi:hypothetical protein
MAIVATNAETSERGGEREERASQQGVFAVRGYRGNLQGPSAGNPRNKSQEGNYRVGSGFASTCQYPRGRGAYRGTRSIRAESRTSVRDGTAPEMGVGLYRGTPAGGGTAPGFVRTGSRTPVGEGSA